MGQFTHYLAVRELGLSKFKVTIEPSTPLGALQEAVTHSTDLRYSPVLQAYLTPGQPATVPPASPRSIAFFFSPKPYQALGTLKPMLSSGELKQVFFTQGLASILMLNCSDKRAEKLRAEIGNVPTEYWAIRRGQITPEQISIFRGSVPSGLSLSLDLSFGADDSINVYVEQIAASVATLWVFYGLYFIKERKTLVQIVKTTKKLVERYEEISAEDRSLNQLRQQNAIISALIELSASLSYSVTQGISGASPILSNRSPFPHHSLLGVGGSIRCLTNFTRYIEAAFETRSPAEVINRQYATKTVAMPFKIGRYESGSVYQFRSEASDDEEFDSGGDFPMVDNLPLLAHFSLRHGFKEAKFSVTAASESLTAECLPAWTLMTLSHEIMHSQVRNIFQALFGATWEEDYPDERWKEYFAEFSAWTLAQGTINIPRKQAIRNAVLNFCCASERQREIVAAPRPSEQKRITVDDLHSYFKKYRRMAAELFVHFHDYYFAYACQPKLYVMSLWATWTTVAAPVARPQEYLIRTLATIACGTGLEARAAFNGAAELLEEGLATLESVGITSALFDELKSFLSGTSREAICEYFKPAYYLIDQVRASFASAIVAKNIDSIQSDPFAGGSTAISDYSSNPYVFGETEPETRLSPIRFSLAAFIHELLREPREVDDLQWLTAWNALVISSQEVE